MAWHGMAWHGMAWHDMTWHDMTWHDMTWHDVTCASGSKVANSFMSANIGLCLPWVDICKKTCHLFAGCWASNLPIIYNNRTCTISFALEWATTITIRFFNLLPVWPPEGHKWFSHFVSYTTIHVCYKCQIVRIDRNHPREHLFCATLFHCTSGWKVIKSFMLSNLGLMFPMRKYENRHVLYMPLGRQLAIHIR
jgi:hypothetical protein